MQMMPGNRKKKPGSAEKALVARVRAMEERYDAASLALGGLEEALDGYEQVAEDLAALRDYLESGRWRKDFEADEAGRIPAEVKRGVLSEDGLYELLEEADRMREKLKVVLQDGQDPVYGNE